MSAEEILILTRTDIVRCLAEIDPVEVVAEVLRLHALGFTALPAEGYLPWQNSQDQYCRALAMLGSVTAPEGQTARYGMKLINASVGNPALGLERAGGFTVLFDPETARPDTLLEAGYLSAMRTASYTACSLRELGPGHFEQVSIVGCGTLARMHIRLLRRYFPAVTRISLFDLDSERMETMAAEVRMEHPQLTVQTCASARACFEQGEVVITLTTSSQPYAAVDWIRPGALIAHVSLDDIDESVFAGAEAIWVDDLDLIQDNPRRILGRLLTEGAVARPEVSGTGPRVTGSLGDVLLGRSRVTRPSTGYLVSNPFGLSVLDVGLAAAVAEVARGERRGSTISLL